MHTTNINRNGFNLLFFTYLSIAVTLSIWLWWKDIKAGAIYFGMFTGTTCLLMFLFMVVKDDDTLGPITKYIKVPLSTLITLAVLFDFVGFLAPLIIKLVLWIVGSTWKLSGLAIPLFGADIDTAFQSFSAAEISNSMMWNIFVMMYDAGTVETYTYNFMIPIISVLIALTLWYLGSKINSKNPEDRKPSKAKLWFVAIFSVVFQPALLFVFSHLMNATYKLKEFIWAGIFLIASNISIYFQGVFLLFWNGWHQGNNLVFLIEQHGFWQVLEGFGSWFGIIFVLFKALQLYFIINNWKEVGKDFWSWFSR